MKENIFDRATDVLKERLNLGRGIIQERFKNTKPYRKEPMTREEQIYYANQIDPELELQLRQTMGDDTIDEYYRRIAGRNG